MADQPAPRAINAPFPAPPPFWKHFTEENISRLEAIISAPADAAGEQKPPKISKKHPRPSELRNLEVSPELSYLIPPPPPTGDIYTVFSETINLSQSIPFPPNVTRLIPSPPPSDPTPTLVLLTKSLLLNFLELSSTLSVNPTQSQEKLEDIQTLFVNAHHLINTYRPHQARETLIKMLEERLDQGKKEIDEMEKWQGDVEGWLGEREKEAAQIRHELEITSATDRNVNGQDDTPSNGVPSSDKATDRSLDETKELWQIIRDIENEQEDSNDTAEG